MIAYMKTICLYFIFWYSNSLYISTYDVKLLNSMYDVIVADPVLLT